MGIEFFRSSKDFVVNQRKYALELIAEAGLGNAKPSLAPLEWNIKLTNVEFDQAIKTTDILFEDVPLSYEHKAGHSLYSTDLKSIYETTKNVEVGLLL